MSVDKPSEVLSKTKKDIVDLPRVGKIWSEVRREYVLKAIKAKVRKIGLSLQIFLIFGVFSLFIFFACEKICSLMNSCPRNDYLIQLVWVVEKFQELIVGSFGIMAYVATRINERRNQERLNFEADKKIANNFSQQCQIYLKLVENYFDILENFLKIVDQGLEKSVEKKFYIKIDAFNLIPDKPVKSFTNNSDGINFEKISTLLSIEGCIDTIDFMLKGLRLNQSSEGVDILEPIWTEIKKKIATTKLLMIFPRVELSVDAAGKGNEGLMYLEIFKLIAEQDTDSKLGLRAMYEKMIKWDGSNPATSNA